MLGFLRFMVSRQNGGEQNVNKIIFVCKLFWGIKIRLKMAVGTTLCATKGHLMQKRQSALENLIKECGESKATWGLLQNDFVFALTFWSMAECGFQCISSESPHKGQTEDGDIGPLPSSGGKILPEDWKHETRQIYQAQFVLPPYQDCPVKLVALPAGDVLCINVLASNVSRYIGLKSLAIHSPGYVPRPQEDAVSCKFSGLTDFQFLLKNVIIWPIRCSILTDQGIMNGSLCGLSDEIKLKIVAKLSASDVLTLSQTCHDLNRICNDQNLWKTLFHSTFKGLCKCSSRPEDCDETTDWKESYKRAYVEKPLEKNSHDSTLDSYQTAHDGPYGSEIDLDID